MTSIPIRPDEFHVFDTSLRDGGQQEGISLSVTTARRCASVVGGAS